MKTITTSIYQFNELTDIAKQNAIAKYRDKMYYGSDIASWVVDDCYLFEPLNMELVELFGEEYTKLANPIMGNTRKVYFDTDRISHLDADEGIEINNERMFLLWLGVPESMHEFVYFRIRNTHARYPDTIIEFEDAILGYEFSDEENKILDIAADKFSDHMHNVLNRISEGIEYYYSDDYIIQELENNMHEFTEDGAIY